MLSYCLKCRGNTENKNLKVVRIKNKRITILLKCVVCNSKKVLRSKIINLVGNY